MLFNYFDEISANGLLLSDIVHFMIIWQSAYRLTDGLYSDK